MEYNKKHGIVPKTIKKSADQILLSTKIADEKILKKDELSIKMEIAELKRNLNEYEVIEELERRMYIAASLLDFEKAALYRDAIRELKRKKKRRRRNVKIPKKR